MDAQSIEAPTSLDEAGLARLYPHAGADTVARLARLGKALDGRVPYAWAAPRACVYGSVSLERPTSQQADAVAEAYANSGSFQRCVHLALDDEDPDDLVFSIVATARDGPPPAAPKSIAGAPRIDAQTVDDIGRLYPWLSAADLIRVSAVHDALADVSHAWSARVADGPLVHAVRFSGEDTGEIVAAIRRGRADWPPSSRSQTVILAVDQTHGRRKDVLVFGPMMGKSPTGRSCIQSDIDFAHLYPFLAADDLRALEALDEAIDAAPRRWVGPSHPDPPCGSRPIAIGTKVGAKWLAEVSRDASTDRGQPCRLVLTVRGAVGIVRYWTEPDDRCAYAHESRDKDVGDDSGGGADHGTEAGDASVSESVPIARKEDGVVTVPAAFEAMSRSRMEPRTTAWVCALMHGLGAVPVHWTEERLAGDVVLHLATPPASAAAIVNGTYGRLIGAEAPAHRILLGVDSVAVGGPLFFYRVKADSSVP